MSDFKPGDIAVVTEDDKPYFSKGDVVELLEFEEFDKQWTAKALEDPYDDDWWYVFDHHIRMVKPERTCPFEENKDE